MGRYAPPERAARLPRLTCGPNNLWVYMHSVLQSLCPPWIPERVKRARDLECPPSSTKGGFAAPSERSVGRTLRAITAQVSTQRFFGALRGRFVVRGSYFKHRRRRIGTGPAHRESERERVRASESEGATRLNFINKTRAVRKTASTKRSVDVKSPF